MRLVHYRDAPVALVTADHARLVPWVEQLDKCDPVRCFICALCLFAMEHESGALAGRFSQQRAERSARGALMPADEFAPLADIADADLAELFGVPPEQVGLRREELRHPDASYRQSLRRRPPSRRRGH